MNIAAFNMIIFHLNGERKRCLLSNLFQNGVTPFRRPYGRAFRNYGCTNVNIYKLRIIMFVLFVS